MLSILQRKFRGIATRDIETEDKPISVILITQFCDSSIEVGLTILLTQTTTGVQLEAFGFAGDGWFGCTED